MSKYQSYPEYKDSGVEWLGEIPSHWQMISIKYVAQLTPKKSAIPKDKMSKVCSFVPMEKLKLNKLTLDEEVLVNQVYDGYTYFEDEDVLIAKVTPCFENKNMAVASGLANSIGFGSSEIYVLRCNRKANNQFLFYRLQEDSFMAIATAAMTGAGGLKRVPAETLNTYQFGLPNWKEQIKISSFLEHETAKIDNLLEKQQQLIELLKEKRQAVICHAVTKGLNPDVPMKDSGVEWLGEVPEHWASVRVKQISSFISSGPRGWSDFVTDEGSEIFLQSGDLNNELGLQLDKAKRVSPPKNAEGVRARLAVGDVVICITGANTGRVAIVSELSQTTYINQHLSLIRPQALNVNSAFLGYSLASSAGRSFFEVTQYGLKEGLSLSNVSEAPLALPPRHEQDSIVKYLESIGNNYDNLSRISRVQVELLKERRAALISAAVTGKIDVRNWVAPTNDTEVNQEPQEATA
ncbi:restriction endonuclease subunit S [Serratia fonticola]|uniref:restriction endonuclease subunit S n=1 Tax=Serratia fonticola TaxID=47917 RepID=UPI00217AE464|nr:restriction endonuclease subunit S [Serratia fonticola]CAI1211630.1 EcoKI restriction-modification system protein HsdS [Serratia fonticola]